VVRRRSAKPLYGGSNPPAASNSFFLRLWSDDLLIGLFTFQLPRGVPSVGSFRTTTQKSFSEEAHSGVFRMSDALRASSGKESVPLTFPQLPLMMVSRPPESPRRCSRVRRDAISRFPMLRKLRGLPWGNHLLVGVKSGFWYFAALHGM
jgi:hypothetical protein